MDLIQILTDFDTQLLLSANCHHCEAMDNFMEIFSWKWTWVPFYASFLYVMLRNFSWKVTLTCLLVIALLITISDQTASHLLRPWIQRMRPSNPENPISPMIHLVDNYRSGAYGFPSAHSTNAWSLTFFAIYLVRRRFLTWFMVMWALLTCYSRVYLGVHYPGDLFVGMLIGLACATLVYYLFQRLRGEDVHAFKPAGVPLKDAWVPLGVGSAMIIGLLICSFFMELI